ncbi:Gluconate 2-dehydrogenase subunit 3 [Pseudarcicella hirudinis]|uniref:Gluconate 2-dehydrogenase subunit 3 n=1 Tax=Pseudarcicella hirudinis TaxID=1079859 RepID=A0A1I5NNG9_9BACT|nr:gluconate 2-dehydrogenase subunit 3 family protein [Pseudarcicella hirudinis]SFP23378.1 Gluconate 2-dehydrogenase subunit 3 [Pseudarcicella hirudinis]
MERRSALKNMAMAAGGLINLPSWANSWDKTTVQNHQLKVSASQEAILAEIVETIIPTTDTPGAKTLGIHQFAMKMVADCYDKIAQDNFRKGINTVEELSKTSFGKSLTECDATQKNKIIQDISESKDADTQSFYKLIKGLTIQGYLKSEYVLSNLLIYELVPARFHGCVPVKK